MRAMLAGCLMAAFFVPAANAQRACAPTDEALKYFREQHEELPAWEGVANGGIELILLQSESGSWTLLSLQGAVACLVASGTDGNAIIAGRGV
ncbi:hypothetical protein JYP46_01585 [Nitratireductor aquimarinus]|uniref:hypothetical protein n=1 Tax=Alphaproteobacteria TaxID=28211 RepID=UPI0019D3EA23|nr:MULTISPECIES: hypothetical protein [Alphaproteobacteria]MBN7755503.1 hypothetical protein [Nitratireductor aquimarinus]MBY5998258.1 hypothetical protein [Tritonibacter mobilis]MBY6020287.1 hypothetical protein [Nitratireductor sp. DP7N14-4]